ncbi:MAG: hypothetical protein E6I60_08915, partial [Chloroflexi bacterium]
TPMVCSASTSPRAKTSATTGRLSRIRISPDEPRRPRKPWAGSGPVKPCSVYSRTRPSRPMLRRPIESTNSKPAILAGALSSPGHSRVTDFLAQKTAQAANPGARIPRGRAAGALTIAIDTREKYGWKFAGRPLAIERRALPAGDDVAIVDEAVVAVVERKTLENLATSLSDGGLAFQMQRLAEVARAAIVVEGDYPDLFRTQPGRGSWLADMLGRLAVRYPEVPVIFSGSRRFAEEWAYRFLGAVAADRVESS